METIKEKLNELKFKVINRVKKTVAYVKAHPAETAAMIALGISAVQEGRRVYDRVESAKQDRISRTTVYCNDIQSRVRLKHELDAQENRELRYRMNCGQTKFEALDEMGLIK